MNFLKHGWFSQIQKKFWPAHIVSVKCDKLLYKGKSKYQDITVFYNKDLGNVLVLDDHIQCTEFDEHVYQEMIAFIPLNCHPNPEKVLVIGGGDGGVVREVVKHPLVKEVHLCEIDEDVIKVSKTYLTDKANGFTSEKLKLHIGDGFEFLKNNKNSFDVIITDSKEPEEPSESYLFKESYFRLVHDALKPNGIMCNQGGTHWLYRDMIITVMQSIENVFPSVSYALSQVPSYPTGILGFFLASSELNKSFSKSLHEFDQETLDKMDLKYYNNDVHRAAFALPNSFEKALRKNVHNYTK